MTDVLTPEQRRKCMSRIKSKDTKPEMVVRKMVRALGYRYRLHRKNLPGKPDLVFSQFRKVIFVHGCFWHRHRCRYGRVIPQTNAAFWEQKRESNRARDLRNRRDLKKLGWNALVVWECWIKDSIKMKRLEIRMRSFLDNV
ncbi:MAG: very short patch repair endonuclease [Nitrospirota bacterium]|nr:very short patch repair endonuclease [Nitrospirota bacterium]